ncbi:DUF1189 domain-containing protein [Clostridium sp. SM-530-WT-3G]|uniref:DUF1189 domain-containing protein n=1 Tax=Clostridium sp. SM-530-WT-3G TaxID=2725303 RepID=UPI00145D63F2|nr:DUF1189 domain-containing protein [Clostridium sp. SM-530-WT-3G]NME83384.1 DUF1189 domain-containing protein [Clostridium sp. SM-530-WT-3G]
MKKRMGIVHKFAYSFYDFSAYKEFLIQGLGKAIFYIFLVTIAFSTLSNIRTVSQFNDDISRIENKFNKESPDFEYKDGKLTMDYDGPIYYKYTGDSPILSVFINDTLINGNLIVDTSGKTDASALDSYSKGTYVDSDSVTIKTGDNDITTKKLKDLFNTDIVNSNDITIDKATILSSFHLLNEIFDISMYISYPIVSFLSSLCAAFFILGPLTIIFSKNLNINLTYKNACTISLYAMTMPLLLESLSTISGLYIPEFELIFYIIALIYCFFALKNIKKSNNTKINALL